MKIRYVVVIFTISVTLFIGAVIGQTRNGACGMVSISELNAVYMQVSAGLADGRERTELERLYGCEIYLKTDTDYVSEVLGAISHSRILMDYEEGEQLLGKIVFSGERDMLAAQWRKLRSQMLLAGAGLLFAGYLLIGCIYSFYIRPFSKLKQFAANIAKGKLDTPLSMNKRNYFGVFTESFDLMREELKTARENEYKANISKKELVAGLSHDMKTPVAAIKATCEVLKAKVLRGGAWEKADILEKAEIIEQKSDMIDRLIGNMFHAALEELENLKMETTEEPSTLIPAMFEELRYYENIRIKNSIPECLVFMDSLRLRQVIDNVINNSYKYAGTDIEVAFQEQEIGIIVEIRDFGDGIPEEELPLVTEKYYRGSNGKGKSGAGLGLFLAKYFMDNMKGTLECHNDNGFVINLFLRKV